MGTRRVPTSDVDDEVGGLLDDGSHLGDEKISQRRALSSPMSVSERIRAEAQQRASTQDWDDIVSPDSLRLKVLDESSDESELELSPTKRPRRAAAQRAPKYNVKLSLTKPASEDAQKKRGMPQPMTKPASSRAPPSIALLLRQKHMSQRKGLDREGLAWADHVTKDPSIAQEVAAAQDRMNSAHISDDVFQDPLPLAIPEENQTELVRLLQRDAAQAHDAKGQARPMLWKTQAQPVVRHWPPAIQKMLQDRETLDARLSMGVASFLPVSRAILVDWLVHEIISSPGEGARTALIDLARMHPDACAQFWQTVPKHMLELGADPSLVRSVDRDAGSCATSEACAPSAAVQRLWRTCRVMPLAKTAYAQFPLLVLYAATQPQTISAECFLEQLALHADLSAALASLYQTGQCLRAEHQWQLVQAVPGLGACRALRSDLARCLVCRIPPGGADGLAAVAAYCARAIAESDRAYPAFHAELELLSYAVDVPRLMAAGAPLALFASFLSALSTLDQSIYDHRGSSTERSVCKDTLQRLQLRVRYQIQACIEHDPKQRASWTTLLRG